MLSLVYTFYNSCMCRMFSNYAVTYVGIVNLCMHLWKNVEDERKRERKEIHTIFRIQKMFIAYKAYTFVCDRSVSGFISFLFFLNKLLTSVSCIYVIFIGFI